jgi:MoxR-like ATPase
MHAEDVIRHQHLVRRVPVPDHIYQYAARLVRKTRPADPTTPAWLKPLVSWGAGPRAVQFLILGGKARALLYGRTHVSTEDIQALARPVLRHRLVVNFAAESEGLSSDHVIERLVRETPSKDDELTRDARFQQILAS